MPVIDPRIIANSMMTQAPQMPDVNAMMQAQTQGYQNMYNTQRQVSADQQAMQAREAEAATQALAPAIASVFSDPSDKGLDAALTMVPPQYQSVAKQQMDRLRQVPDIGNRKNMIRAALMQDERGRALLQQIEASANAQLNAAVAGRRQSLDEQRLAIDAAAAGQPKPMSEYETNVIRLREKEASAAGPDGVKLKPGERMTAEGNVEAVPGSETYRKQKTAQSTDYNAAKNAIRELDKTRDKVKKLKDTTGFQKALGTGTVMANTPNIPIVSNFTGAYDFQTKYKNLKGAVAALGHAAASLARRLSAVRSFSAHLVRSGLRRDDFTELAHGPKLRRKLPGMISAAEAAKVVSAPDTATPQGLRDRAMLEMMYGSGLRISELCGLEIQAVDAESALVRVTGKGSKDRVVPVGETALLALQAYLKAGRPRLVRPKTGSALFLSARGVAISRKTFWLGVKQAAKRAGVSVPVKPHLLRHAVRLLRPAAPEPGTWETLLFTAHVGLGTSAPLAFELTRARLGHQHASWLAIVRCQLTDQAVKLLHHVLVSHGVVAFEELLELGVLGLEFVGDADLVPEKFFGVGCGNKSHLSSLNILVM